MGLKKLINNSLKTAIITGSMFIASSSYGQKRVPTRQDTINSPEKYYKKYDAFSVIDLERKILQRKKDTIVEHNLNKLLNAADSIFKINKPKTTQELVKTYENIETVFEKKYKVIPCINQDFLIDGLWSPRPNLQLYLDCDLFTAIYKTINDEHNIQSEPLLIEEHSVLEVNFNKKKFIWDAKVKKISYSEEEFRKQLGNTKAKIHRPGKNAFYIIYMATNSDEAMSKENKRKYANMALKKNPEIELMKYNKIYVYLSTQPTKQEYDQAKKLFEEVKKETLNSIPFKRLERETQEEFDEINKQNKFYSK